MGERERPTRSDWEALAAKEVKGDLGALTWHTPEGIGFVAKLTFSDDPYVIVYKREDYPQSFFSSRLLLNQMLPAVTVLPNSVRHQSKPDQIPRRMS